MKKIDPVWLHRIIRFGGGIALIVVATQFKDAWALYGFGAIMIITGFVRPKRCLGECSTGQDSIYAGENKK
jgi:hypothetical protein